MEHQNELIKVKEEYCSEDQTSSTLKQLEEFNSFALKHEELAEVDIKSEFITLEQQIELTKVKEENCLEDHKSSSVKQLEEYNSFALKHEELDIKSEIADEKLFTCEECPDSFAYSELLDLHKTIHNAPVDEKKQCPCCQRKYSSISSYKLHIENHLTSYRECTSCSKIFFYGHLFRKHIAEHNPNDQITCPYCQKCFTQRSSLNSHISVIHTNDRVYICNQCSESFSRKQNLIAHIKYGHVPEYLQKCSTCKKTFENKDLLDQHIKQHHITFYKKCMVCNKEFTIYAGYFNHLRYCEPELDRRKETAHGEVLKHIMNQEPGPSGMGLPCRKRARYDPYNDKILTDAELRQLLNECEEEEEDPFFNDSDADFVLSSTSGSDSDDEADPFQPPTSPIQLSPTPIVTAAATVTQTKKVVATVLQKQGNVTSVWTKTVPNKTPIPFTGTPGLLIKPNGPRPIDYFYLIATDEFFDDLVQKANHYAVEILSRSYANKARITKWKDITIAELKIFFGLFFHMGTIRLKRINDYWKKHHLFNLTAFSNFMSRNRFLLILRALRFEDEQTPRTQIGKIQPLINFFNQRMSLVYSPKRELSLDEPMVLWRGRLRFPLKRHKYGIKLYVLSESSGLTLKILVYTGSSYAIVGGSGHTEKVVLELMRERFGFGHILYMDNLYNSVGLTMQLLENQTYVTGTLRAGRKGNPKEVVDAKLGKGELVMFYNDKGVCVIKWKDRKEILAISSEHGGQLEDMINRRNEVRQKPKMIIDYNKFMADVENGDQMMTYYSCEHKKIIWYKKLGIHVFQIMLINSHRLFQEDTNNKMELYNFRLSVIEDLLGLPPQPPVSKVKITHLAEMCEKGENGKTKRRRCQVCWMQNKQRKDSLYCCPLCPGSPGLCLTPCFRIYHSQ